VGKEEGNRGKRGESEYRTPNIECPMSKGMQNTNANANTESAFVRLWRTRQGTRSFEHRISKVTQNANKEPPSEDYGGDAGNEE
jgi:hypothetical protein